MSLFDVDRSGERGWTRVGAHYAITRKPRNLNVLSSAEIPFVPMDAIPQDGSYEPSWTVRTPQSISSGTYFESGDLLVSKITPSFENGKQALVRSLPTPFGYATTEVIPLRPRDANQDPRLLFFYLLHPEVRHYIAERMEGSTGRQRVPENVLLNVPIPYLEGNVQESISDALEAIRTASAIEQSAEKTCKKLKSSTMNALFTRGLRGEAQKDSEIGPIPESWSPRSLLELCEIWSGGTPRKSTVEYWTGDIPWVSGKDLKRPALDDTIDHVSIAGVEAGSRIAPVGSVLLLVRGMGLAKDLPVAVINRAMAFNQDVKALVTKGEYTGAFLRSAIYAGKQRLLSQIVASAHGTMTLNLHDVENFKIACPGDPDEANEIAELLTVLEKKIDVHRRKRAVLDQLFTALLHKLMTGEIAVIDLDLSALSAASFRQEPTAV